MKVIVCGDSFNCNDALYPGVHWTEKIVQLNSSIDLTNLSICGASNLLIHLQIDSAIKSKPDYIIVNFTSSLRTNIRYKNVKTTGEMISRFYKLNSANNDNTDLISFPYSGIDIFNNINHAQQTLLKTYLLDCVDLDVARLENYYIINSALNSLLDSNIKFLYGAGGFDYEKFLKPGDIKYQFPKFIDYEIQFNLWDHWDAWRNVHPYFHVTDEVVHHNLASHYLSKLTQ